MVTLKRCRAVDAAAGQLIVREAGGLVAFTGYEDPLAAPLDLVPRSPVIAARTERPPPELRAPARRSRGPRPALARPRRPPRPGAHRAPRAPAGLTDPLPRGTCSAVM